MKTKDRILLGALELFNTHAASEVTTNNIARELKMSPGNLYFHFKNKEQIIRELFKRLAQETSQIWKPQTKLAKKTKRSNLSTLSTKTSNSTGNTVFFIASFIRSEKKIRNYQSFGGFTWLNSVEL